MNWEDKTLSGGLDDGQIIESVLEKEIPKEHQSRCSGKTDNPGSEIPLRNATHSS
jgi:hypothetical protein